jgi:protein SCO1/2
MVLTSAVRWVALTAIALLGLLALSAVGAVLLTDREPMLPRYGQVPDFELTNQAGQTVTDDQLRGRVWVGDFIFTQCPSICPILTTNMAKLQQWLEKQPQGQRVQLVSFSVDPEHDTPQVLRQFGQRYGANFDQWHFLTGPSNKEMWQLSEEGFKLTAQLNAPDAAMKIAHSPRMVLVDARGRIRGYYTGTRPEAIKTLKKDLRQLLQRAPASSVSAEQPSTQPAAVPTT